MSLDERLERAREDYRALAVDEQNELVVGLDGPPSARSGGRARWLVAAAVVALAGVVGGAVLIGAEDDDGITETADPSTTTEVPTTTEVSASEVAVEPAGPYEDGQRVTVRFTPALVPDVSVGLCAAVEDAPGESCGGTIGNLDALPAVDGRSVTVTLRRRVATPDGEIDCGDEAVSCSLVATDEEGTSRRSAGLDFVDDPSSGDGVRSLSVEPAGAPGTFTLRPEGLEAHPSWLDRRAVDPSLAETMSAFVVRQCSYGASARTEGPFGEDLWDQELSGPEAETCAAGPADVVIDADDPDRPLTVALPTLLHGYGGWADCRVDRCFLAVSRTIVTSPNGGSEERVVTTTLPPAGPWADAVRPTLTVDTPGPHGPGQTVSVTIAGLPEGVDTIIGTCHVANPWGCGYDLTPVGNGTHQVALHASQLTGCGPEECYLELDAGSEGLAPLATAALDTPG